MMPASVMNPIIEVVVNGAAEQRATEHDADQREREWG